MKALAGACAHSPPPQFKLIMASKRDLIRWFITEVHWATPQNVAYFMEGRVNKKILSAYSSELSEMQKSKDRTLRIKKIKNQDGKSAYTMTAKTLPTFLFNHDVCLRNVIGKFLHDRGMAEVSFDKPSDAVISHYRIELDNGHMSEAQLEEKISENYSKESGQVVFIMRHRERAELEIERLMKVFEIAVRLFPGKPNKICGACYTMYLENGSLFNCRGRII